MVSQVSIILGLNFPILLPDSELPRLKPRDLYILTSSLGDFPLAAWYLPSAGWSLGTMRIAFQLWVL